MPLEPRDRPAARLEVGRNYHVRASVDGLTVQFTASLAAVEFVEGDTWTVWSPALAARPIRLWCGSDSEVEVEEVPL